MEIFFSGTWGTVFDDRTDINDAKVVCRQLGYNTHRKYIILNCMFTRTVIIISYWVQALIMHAVQSLDKELVQFT